VSSGAPTTGGVVRPRKRLLARLNAWRKRTPLNPYWMEMRWLHRATASLAPKASGRLLDVGVGERPYGRLFAPHVSRYIGLEYPPVADNLHPEIWRLLDRIQGIIDVWGDGQALPFASERFDTVLSLEVLEHVEEPDRLVREFARVLRPGGALLVTIPFAAPLHQLPFDFYRYTPGGIRSLLERNGFELATCEPRGNFAAVAGSLLAQYLLRALASSGQLHDGSVRLSRWRAPLVLPCLALVQLAFELAARFSSDTSYCLGYTIVARKRA
jgi:SAM-dependent methyltransferase